MFSRQPYLFYLLLELVLKEMFIFEGQIESLQLLCVHLNKGAEFGLPLCPITQYMYNDYSQID